MTNTLSNSLRAGLAALAVFAVLLLFAPTLYAQKGPKGGGSKSIAVYVEGQDAASVRQSIVDILPKGLKVVDQNQFEKAMARAGQRGQLGNAIALPRMREKSLQRVRKALEYAKADAVIIGRVRKNKKLEPEVYLLYVDAIPGDLAVDEPIPLKGDRAAALHGLLDPPLEQLAPAATSTKEPATSGEEPKPDEKDEAKKEGEPSEEGDKKDEGEGEGEGEEEGAKGGEREAHDPGTALFVVGANFELGGRFFDYSDPLAGANNLRPYDVFGAPILLLNGELYPAASTKITFLKDLGVTVMFAHAFALESATEGGTAISTSYDRFGVGLRFRHRFGDGKTDPILGVNAQFGLISFGFGDTSDPTLKDALPDVSYKFLRLGLDGRIPLGERFAFALGADYLVPFSAGQVYTRFTGSSVGGIDARGGAIVGISSGLEARLMVEYTRFFYSFEPEPGNTHVAGGALDQYLGLQLGLAYVY